MRIPVPAQVSHVKKEAGVGPPLLLTGTFTDRSGFADAEHPGPAFYTDTLGARFAVLHPDGLDILHFPVGLAFHAISFHKFASWILTLIIAANLKLVNRPAPAPHRHTGLEDYTRPRSENRHWLCPPQR